MEEAGENGRGKFCSVCFGGAPCILFASERDLFEVAGAVRLPLSPTHLVKMTRGSYPGSRSGEVSCRVRSGPTPPWCLKLHDR